MRKKLFLRGFAFKETDTKTCFQRMSIRERTEGLKRMLSLLVFAQDNLAISYTMGILDCRNSIERIVYSPANF